ncbi:hypothetical protein [Leptolyngbya sp. FACHB-16]|uniref:DUF7219 family protein n=1 Tax=unclassified Leptolyngbya TaxID=2650499 RepID=UPI00168518A3|nr:hypothetical protein [Leptolyngbya sp. FACHB-16]MBD2152942.1 hypothetical protein [Leptolyngbya sp. FACHB-16]
MVNPSTSYEGARNVNHQIDTEEIKVSLDTQGEGISSKPEYRLQEFAHIVMNICTQAQVGEMSSEEAYQQIKDHWNELKHFHNKHDEKRKKGRP